MNPAEMRLREATPPKAPKVANPAPISPTRYVQPLMEAERMVWRVVVRREDVAHVRNLMAVGDVLRAEDVRGWFRKHASRWPVPPDSAELSAFVDALNALRITKSRTVQELQTSTPERTEVAARRRRVRDAIDTIAAGLPGIVVLAQRSQHPIYSSEELLALAHLADAARAARGIIVALKPPHREKTWHQDAQLIEWHVRRVLACSRISDPGDDWNGPMVKVVRAALQRTSEATAPHAVAKALQRAAAAQSAILTREEVEQRNGAIAA